MKIGSPAPGFTLQTLDHQQVKLSDLEGSVVLLDFWATWCPPCQASLPGLSRISADPGLAARGLKVFAVNAAQEDPQTVHDFLMTNHITVPVLMDPDTIATREYQADVYLPTTVLVGRDGTVKYATQGFEPGVSETQLSTAIEKALSDNSK